MPGKVEDFVPLFIVFLMVIWYASGTPLQDSPFVRGAAAFLTVPIDIIGPLIGGNILLMLAFFFVMTKYFGWLEGFLGEAVQGFVIISIVILLLTGVWV